MAPGLATVRLLKTTIKLVAAWALHLPYAGAIDPPDCSQTVSIRWASSTDRLYLESSFNSSGNVPPGTSPPTGGGCTNLTAIAAARTNVWDGNKGPVYHYDVQSNSISDDYTGDFYINSSIYIEDNVWLDISSAEYGGDVNRVYLRSDRVKFIQLRAYGGRLSFNGVTVRSLDRSGNDGAGSLDTTLEDGRSFVSAISEIITDPTLNCTGMAKKTMGEARLDIHDSVFAYLGYYASESYGITYKVRGLCKDKRNLEVMDQVAVWGDITDSEIKHLYFGHYSYGHQGGNWSGNHVHHNIGYGFDPHDDSDYVKICNNTVHDNGWHGIIASKRCDHVTISGNVVFNNGYNGIMLHRSCDHSTISDNTAFDNGDSGVALYESSGVNMFNNHLHGNSVAVRLSMGSSNCSIYDNLLNATGTTGNKYSIFMYRGSDEPGVEGSDGRPMGNTFTHNVVVAESETVKISDNFNTTFAENHFIGDFARFRNSTGVEWVGNTVEKTFTLKLEGDTCFAGGQPPYLRPVCH